LSLPRLEKSGCEYHFVASNDKLRALLRYTEVDIVLSVSLHVRLFELLALPAGLPVNVFHLLPVEEGCWWLPVLRSGVHCLGMPALRKSEFHKALAVMIRDMRIAHSKAIESTDVNRYRGIRHHDLITAKDGLKLTSGPGRGVPFMEAIHT
jgi:hypothetical protein